MRLYRAMAYRSPFETRTAVPAPTPGASKTPRPSVRPRARIRSPSAMVTYASRMGSPAGSVT